MFSSFFFGDKSGISLPARQAYPAAHPEDADLFNFRLPAVIRPFPVHKAFLYALICLLWATFGIFGRDPWKPEETILVAIITDIVQNGLHYPPLLFAEPYLENPPLYLYLAALTAKLTSGWLPLHEGARLANILLLFGGMGCLWLAAYLVYGARAAWLAVLLVTGTAGFMVRAHVLNFGVPAFFGIAAMLAGAAVVGIRRPAAILAGGGVIAAAAFFLLFAVSWSVMFAAFLSVLLWMLAEKNRAGAIIVVAFVFPAVLSPLIMPIQGAMPLVELSGRWNDGFSFATLADELNRWLRVSAWSLFPLLPLAAIGIWIERHRAAPLARFALLTCLICSVLFFIEGGDEEDLFLLLAPLAMLAGRALQVMSNDYARLLEFFAILAVGVFLGGGLWLVWLALYTGTPQMVADFMRESLPGFVLPPVRWAAVLLAALLTVGWFVLAVNFRRSNERAAVNWCCGITLLWAVFNLLLVGYVDSGKSYRTAAEEVALTTDGACLMTTQIDKHWRAQLYYFGTPIGKEDCPYLLTPEKSDGFLWSGGRVAGERYYLYRRF